MINVYSYKALTEKYPPSKYIYNLPPCEGVICEQDYYTVTGISRLLNQLYLNLEKVILDAGVR